MWVLILLHQPSLIHWKRIARDQLRLKKLIVRVDAVKTEGIAVHCQYEVIDQLVSWPASIQAVQVRTPLLHLLPSAHKSHFALPALVSKMATLLALPASCDVLLSKNRSRRHILNNFVPYELVQRFLSGGDVKLRLVKSKTVGGSSAEGTTLPTCQVTHRRVLTLRAFVCGNVLDCYDFG